MKLNLTKLVPVGALLCLMVTSCKKNDATNSQTTPSSDVSTNVIKTTNTLGAMESETDQDFEDATSDDLTSDCEVITYSPSKDVFPHSKVIDYGSGCTDENGVTRSGKKFITVYARKEDAAAGKTISSTAYSNFYINGASIQGTAKVSVVTPASSGTLTLKVLNSKTISDNAGNTTSFISTVVRKRISGGDTHDHMDDVYQLTTNSYGTAISGDTTMTTWSYTTDSGNPVIYSTPCHIRTQGSLKISVKENSITTKEYLDYGNGECDRNATLSINNGSPEPITLPFQFFGVKL